jgi:hypothetical protein
MKEAAIPAPESVAELVEADSGERPIVLNTKPLFKLMVEKRASDLFFSSYAPIKIKIEGQIIPVNKQILSPEVGRRPSG